MLASQLEGAGRRAARYTRLMQPLTHRTAEQRSLALHGEVARLLREHPELLARARARVEQWRTAGVVDAAWVAAWSEILTLPVGDVIAVLTDPSERARDLRQCSPFAGALAPRDRWRILRGVSGTQSAA